MATDIGGCGRDLGGENHRRIEGLARLGQFFHEAPFVSLFSADALIGEDHRLFGSRRPHHMQHARNALPAHVHAESDFGNAHMCRPAHHPENPAPPASATPPPMQKPSMAPIVTCSISCQARLSRGPSFRCRRSEPRSIARRDCPFRILQVEAGAERLVTAGQHHDRGVAVILEAARGVGELTQGLRRERIDCRLRGRISPPSIRPSGPRPFSILTKSATPRPSGSLLFVLTLHQAGWFGMR